MDILKKIKTLGQAAQYDLCSSYLCQGSKAQRRSDPFGRWIYPAVMPDGKEILLLKVLMSNLCENDCFYCANRCPQDYRRTTFTPEELAWLFNELRRRGLVQGLFLSSAVAGNTEKTMERMLAAVEIIRYRYRFHGYIHLKILPGASFGTVEHAVRLADRVSVNLEAPDQNHLQRIAGKKDFQKDLLLRMKWIKSLADRGAKTKGGQTTQFVVGAADESDRAILTTTDKLYKELDLRRVYYSAFQPVRGTPLENHPSTPLLREHRLYQADFLFRRYGFELNEITFDGKGNLPLSADPKLVWALNHPERFPIEINTAEREELLRIPGIGPCSVSRILKLRQASRFRELKQLKTIGAVTKRAAPFILLAGKQPVVEGPSQLMLWNSREDLLKARINKANENVAVRKSA